MVFGKQCHIDSSCLMIASLLDAGFTHISCSDAVVFQCLFPEHDIHGRPIPYHGPERTAFTCALLDA